MDMQCSRAPSDYVKEFSKEALNLNELQVKLDRG
jgi:hypothetical protein